MTFIVRHFVLLHVLACFVLLSWLGGGTRGEWLRPWAPWMSLAMLEAVLVFPQQKKSESLFQARERVWKGFFRDPLLYIGLALVVFLLVQGLNGPCELVYSREAGAWTYLPPPIPWLPASIAPKEALPITWWFAPVLAAVVAAKHGLLKSGKRLLLQGFCWTAALLALAGLLQYARKSQFLQGSIDLPGHFFASFGYPNFAAAYFVLAFIVSAGIYVWQLENGRDDGSRPHLMIIPMLLCFAGAIFSFSRAGVLFALGAALICAVYGVARSWRNMSGAGRLQVWAGTIVSVLLLLSVFFLMPKNETVQEIKTTNWSQFLEGRLTGNYQVDCALKMWKDHPVFGVGGWSYRHRAFEYLDKAEWGKLSGKGQANIHNDGIQFLCEHGVVGFTLILAAALLLVVPCVVAWLASAKKIDSTVAKLTPWIFRLNALKSFVLLGVLVTVVHSLFDIPFRSPAVMMLWALALVLSHGFNMQRYVNESVF